MLSGGFAEACPEGSCSADGCSAAAGRASIRRAERQTPCCSPGSLGASPALAVTTAANTRQDSSEIRRSGFSGGAVGVFGGRGREASALLLWEKAGGRPCSLVLKLIRPFLERAGPRAAPPLYLHFYEPRTGKRTEKQNFSCQGIPHMVQ